MLLYALAALCACSASAASDENKKLGPNLIILLIDGYGANLFNRTDPKLQPAASKLLKHGVHAEYLKPVFPTQSYSNWYSLSTGTLHQLR